MKQYHFTEGQYVKYINGETILEGFVVGSTPNNDLVISGDKNLLVIIDNCNLHKVTPCGVENTPLRYGNKKKIYVTKEMVFDSCHNLLEYDGACANLHGHTYKIQATFSGEQDEHGFVVDFKDVKKFMKEYIVDVADHKYLNELYPFNTTAENMASFYFDLLCVAVGNKYKNKVKVESVKLWETPTSFAEYRGEEIEC